MRVWLLLATLVTTVAWLTIFITRGFSAIELLTFPATELFKLSSALISGFDGPFLDLLRTSPTLALFHFLPTECLRAKGLFAINVILIVAALLPLNEIGKILGLTSISRVYYFLFYLFSPLIQIVATRGPSGVGIGMLLILFAVWAKLSKQIVFSLALFIVAAASSELICWAMLLVAVLRIRGSETSFHKRVAAIGLIGVIVYRAVLDPLLTPSPVLITTPLDLVALSRLRLEIVNKDGVCHLMAALILFGVYRISAGNLKILGQRLRKEFVLPSALIITLVSTFTHGIASKDFLLPMFVASQRVISTELVEQRRKMQLVESLLEPSSILVTSYRGQQFYRDFPNVVTFSEMLKMINLQRKTSIGTLRIVIDSALELMEISDRIALRKLLSLQNTSFLRSRFDGNIYFGSISIPGRPTISYRRATL